MIPCQLIAWDAASGKKLQTLGEKITNVAGSGNGKHLWTISLDAHARLWDPATGKERCRLLSFGGQGLACSHAGGFLRGFPQRPQVRD
jgi:WD40 repeat protein